MESLLHQTSPYLLLVLLVQATLSDCTQRRIPNWLTLGGAVMTLALQSLETGVTGFMMGLCGWSTGLLLLLPLYLQGGMGAGDVKLMALVGAFLGWPGVWLAVGWSLIAGALLAILWVVGCRGLMNLKLLCHTIPLFRTLPATLDDKHFPYAGAIATGTFWVLIHQERLLGWQSILSLQ